MGFLLHVHSVYRLQVFRPVCRTVVLRESGTLKFRAWGDFSWALLWLLKQLDEPCINYLLT